MAKSFRKHGRAWQPSPTRSSCRKPHIQDETTSHRDARWNVEWVGRKPDIPHFVGCKPVQTRRLAGRVPSTMAITNIDNQIPKSRHRGWSTHLASRRYRLAQPNRTSSRSFVTPGGIGTHTMHQPRKRNHRDSNITHPSTTSNSIPTGGHSGPPIRGIHQRGPAWNRPASNGLRFIQCPYIN